MAYDVIEWNGQNLYCFAFMPEETQKIIGLWIGFILHVIMNRQENGQFIPRADEKTYRMHGKCLYGHRQPDTGRKKAW